MRRLELLPHLLLGAEGEGIFLDFGDELQVRASMADALAAELTRITGPRLTAVTGLGGTAAARLRKAGYLSCVDLAKATPYQVAGVAAATETEAGRWIGSARTFVSNGYAPFKRAHRAYHPPRAPQ